MKLLVHGKTRVAHPALVKVAKDVFDKHMPTPNQIDHSPGLVGRNVGEADLLKLPSIPYGEAITSAGLVKGVSIVLAYTEAWLRGVGCIPLSNVSFKTKIKAVHRIINLSGIFSPFIDSSDTNEAHGRCSDG